MAFEPVKAGWLKFSLRTDAEAGATAGAAGALVEDSTVAGAVDGAGGTEAAGADDGETDKGGNGDGGNADGGNADGGNGEGGNGGNGGNGDGGVIGYCVCAPA